ncbi:MAG: ADP-ribosylglycohydrolase family protein [Candidatus Thiodiazotropha sp.]|jgi:poly(ADP-ribose) glycohydrolase ARH3
MKAETIPAEKDRFQGTLVALALGDALGAPYEGGLIERGLWFLIGKTKEGKRRWTDDTQMSLDLAESLLHCHGLDQEDLARTFAASYRWCRGYGPGAAKILKRIRRGQDWNSARRAVYAEGSYGNGGAMRSPVAALYCYAQPEQLAAIVQGATEITHAHEFAIEGALLVSRATWCALGDFGSESIFDRLLDEVTAEPLRQRLKIACQWLGRHEQPTPKKIRRTLGAGITAVDSCVTAAYLGLSLLEGSLEDLLEKVRQVGGDVDTIGAMAASIWGARHGFHKIPVHLTHQLEDLDRLLRVADDLWERSVNSDFY